MTMSVLLFPNVFFTSFSRLLIPEFTSLMTKNYKKRILEICKKAFFTISIFSILMFIIFFFFSNENLECSKYIKVLSPLILFIYLDNIIDNVLKSLNKQFEVMFCNILDLLLTISILYFLVPNFGLMGYLLSIVISEGFNFAVSYFQLYKAIGLKITLSIVIFGLFFIFLSIYEILNIM